MTDFGPGSRSCLFSTEGQAIEIANSTPYGLVSYIQANDLRRAHRVAERLVAGTTMISGAPNMTVSRPMGGFGLSGFGEADGPAGLAEFQRIKTVAML